MPDASQFATYARLLRLTPVEEVQVAPSPLLRERAEAAPKRASRRREHGLISFLALVVLPTVLAASYFAFLAADRYQSETRFVLRMPGRTLANAALGSALQSNGVAAMTGVTRSGEDGYVVQQFLESRDALAWAKQHAGLKDAYAGPAARFDIFWRFPNPFEPRSEEGLFWHFQHMMSADFDSTTGVNTLKVQAFTSADARRIAGSLLEAAERLINRLNERARQDAIALAEAEVDRMRQRALAAQSALTSFRESERLIDPSQATLAVLETIGKLAQEAALVSVQISELSKSSPSGPQIAPLRTRRAALEAQIALERQRLAGDAQAIAPRIVEYERLMLEREFAEKALISAMAAVETARVEAMRQQVYLERVANPSQPDYPAYPWRVVWTLVVAVAGYMTWRMWRILSSDALRHVEP
jgi:capsular polysaccharide transport system permease protein